MTSILAIIMYHAVLLLYSNISGQKSSLLILTSVLGFASYILFRNYIRASKSIYLRLSSRIYGALYLFEMNWAVYKEFPHTAKERVDVSLCIFTAIHVAKTIFVEIAKPKLGNVLKWYKDIIMLENYIHIARFGTRIGTDELTIEYIRRNPKSHDPKLLFSILCDNTAMNKLSGKFELLENIKKEADRDQADRNTILSVALKKLGESETETGKKQMGQEASSDEPVRLENLGNGHKPSKDGDTSRDARPASYFDLTKLESLDMAGVITEYSLTRCLGEKDAKTCLKILTQGFESELNYTEFYDNMRQVNIERNSLINFVQGSDYTSKILALSSTGLESILVLSIFAKLFDMADLVQYIIVPLLIFVLPICLNLFDAFVFIVYMHPYDIGDRILLDDDNLIVKKIGLTSTTFERWNNEIVIISNRYIKNKALRNIRRSKSQQWKIEMAILRSDFDKMDRLNKRISAFVMENPAFENFELMLDQITENTFIKVNFIIKHSINHQNGFFMWYVQNRFMRRLLDELNMLHISYSPIEMRIQID